MNSLLEQLKAFSTVVADTGDIEAIRCYEPEDATTNPSLILKAVQSGKYDDLLQQLVDSIDHAIPREKLVEELCDRLIVAMGTRILDEIPGRVSTEVNARLSFDYEGSLAKARKLVQLYEQAGVGRERILIKLAATWEGIQAARILECEGIQCNLTLGIDPGMADLLHRPNVKGIWSVAMVRPLYTDGKRDGHQVFSDYVDGFQDVVRVLGTIHNRYIPRSMEAEQPETLMYECTNGLADAGTVNHPNGGSFTGFVHTKCYYDDINRKKYYFGDAFTVGDGFDYVKLVMTTWNNCDYWHQISSTVKQHQNNIRVEDPGLLAGTPYCGNKWLTNAAHGAKKGSVVMWDHNSSCAGSGC
ncbi:transaldolase family protein [Hahella ganghwensis]|uniref:transaldolase family protein n=1 Tax=Hahella ganghwensis TaxID=286420 RepID=UPI00038287AD|nr:transaldolase family protein [Hahella ganghwensis]